MRDQGLLSAIETVGGISALARALGLAQPSVSAWQRIPADRVVSIETITGLSRMVLRPDLFGETSESAATAIGMDPIEAMRADLYTLLSRALSRAPDGSLLEKLHTMAGDASPLGQALQQLALASLPGDAQKIERDYFNLFIGLGRGELLPYASFYLTGFLHERPLASLRDDLRRLGLERSGTMSEPEDHMAILCEVMATLIRTGSVGILLEQAHLFERHIKPWGSRFFADLESSAKTDFFKSLGALGLLWMDIEEEAFALA